MKKMKILLFITTLHTLVALDLCNDITTIAFGKNVNSMPAAFGDFNSDELTDMFVLSEGAKSVQIMFASVEEPLFQPGGFSCSFSDETITSVVPGDFDGDVFMDILVTTLDKGLKYTNVYILWGKGEQNLNCTVDNKIKLQMIGQPLAIDYNQDMIIDLFGTDINNTRTFWIFDKSRSPPQAIPMKKPDSPDFPGLALPAIRRPHSNAFLDLNDDFYPDLVITAEDNSIEFWYGNAEGFEYGKRLPKIPVDKGDIVGQSLHLDVELEGKMDIVLPVCTAAKKCKILAYSNGTWNDLQIDFKDQLQKDWEFASGGPVYTNAITLRGGDFNMDGYPDLLATLKPTDSEHSKSFLLENVPCEFSCGNFNRSFKIRWADLKPFYNESVMAVFYDFYQDGILDVIFVFKDSVTPDVYKTAAFKNSLDYDANFVKVMVLTGLESEKSPPISPGSIIKKKRTYGTNLPGPSIAYKTTTQDGKPRNAMAAQIPQSAHFSLNLPFTIFGLGRTPNFIDLLTIGLANQSREWPQIIPNSQMVVIPNPIKEPTRWKALLFVTPSKLILLSAAALTATCGLITLIIAALYWKERREDKIEKLQEAHRFHFDAM